VGLVVWQWPSARWRGAFEIYGEDLDSSRRETGWFGTARAGRIGPHIAAQSQMADLRRSIRDSAVAPGDLAAWPGRLGVSPAETLADSHNRGRREDTTSTPTDGGEP